MRIVSVEEDVQTREGLSRLIERIDPRYRVVGSAANGQKGLELIYDKRPDVVITTGTHTAVPMCFIAHFFKKKVIWIETFANSTTQTEAGKLVYPIADLFIVQWESMLELYPNAVMGGWIF